MLHWTEEGHCYRAHICVGMDDSRGLSVQLCGAYTRLHVTRMRFAYQVYNLTPYLQYHPGGVDILVKTAGKDCTALFNRYHAWVNLEGIAGVSQSSGRRYPT
jgi:hypothetical protein